MALGYVRPAREPDAEQIARVQHATWRIAYPRFIPGFAIDQVRREWLVERWAVAVSQPPSSRHRVLVAIERGVGPKGRGAGEAQVEDGPEELVGFAAVGPADEETAAPAESPPGPELAAVTDLLVEPRWGRRGHGSRLLAASVDLWRTGGFTGAVAWAFEEDVATLKFLGSAGWERDGATRALDIEGVLVPQARLHVSWEPPADE